MKKYLMLILVLVFSNIAWGSTANASKQIPVPFVNQAVNSTDYEGLSVSYNMNANLMQKVVCTLANFYKGWIDYSENGAAKESNAYGGVQTVIFTSKGQTGYITETLDQFHADAAGHLLIHNLEKHNTSNAFVSCFYMPDENAKK